MLDRYRTINDWPQLSPTGFLNWTSPWRTLDLLTQQLSHAWDEVERYGENPTGYSHAARLNDNGSELELKVELPGVSKDNVELSVTGDSVFVRASREIEAPQGYTAHRRERSAYKFEHAWKLPVPVDSQKAEAQLRDGVLTVKLPKSPNAQPKQISVKAG
jgi:HSP20 family protein